MLKALLSTGCHIKKQHICDGMKIILIKAQVNVLLWRWILQRPHLHDYKFHMFIPALIFQQTPGISYQNSICTAQDVFNDHTVVDLIRRGNVRNKLITETPSLNAYCNRKATSIKHSVCVSVAFVIQHTKCTCLDYCVISGLSGSNIFLNITS